MHKLTLVVAAVLILTSACTDDDFDFFEPSASTEQSYDEENALIDDRPVWITAGQNVASEFLKLQTAIRAPAAPELLAIENGITLLEMRESQVMGLGQYIHETKHRCGGFLAHESLEEALNALKPAVQKRAPNAAAVVYSLDNATSVDAMMSSLSASTLTSTLMQLTSFKNRYYTSKTGVDAANWLKAHWESIAQGRDDIHVELFAHTGWAQPSVILTIEGSTLPQEVVVLGGHLDSVNSSNRRGVAPGADDDASGIATLSEVLRAIVTTQFRPNRTIQLMAYAAEEVGLRGSKAIAAKYKLDAINVVGVLQLDMTNYKGSTSDIVLYTDYTDVGQNEFVANLVDTYVQVSRTTSTCGYGCSDHASWFNQGFATSMPFEAVMGEHNSAIHTANDTLDVSGGSVEHSMKFAKLAAAFVAELGKGAIVE